LVLSAYALLAASILAGCSHQVAKLNQPLLTAPAVERSDKSVQIYYTEKLKNHQCVNNTDAPFITYKVALGQANVEMFDIIFSSLFKSAEQIRFPSHASKGAWIEVDLESYNGCQIQFHMPINVKYRGVLRAEDGREIARWKGEGASDTADYMQSKMSETIDWYATPALSKMTELAMRNAAADFIFHFLNDARISGWMEN
jgi:hypothetical protein